MSNGVTVLTKEEAQELAANGTRLEATANALKIIDNTSYESAASFLKALKAKRDEVMARPLEAKQKSHGVWKFMSDLCNLVQAPFDQAELVVDRKMIDYRREIERKRQIEAAKAQAKAEAEARKAREAEIAKAKELGDKEAARNLKAAPLHIEAVAPKTPEAPKVAGLPVRKVAKFSYELDKLPRKFLIADEVTIRKMVVALGPNHGIPGVTMWYEEIQ